MSPARGRRRRRDPAAPDPRRQLGSDDTLEGLGRAADAGALSHYADPTYYAHRYAGRLADVAFYERIAQRHGSPILEYGAGNGRVTLALAQRGHEVWAVELSGPMRRDLEARLAAEPAALRRRVKVRPGDMRTVRLRKRFPLVIAPFNVVLHLYTREDVEAFFARVKQHLAPGGRFVFDFSVPQPGDLDRDPEAWLKSPRFRHPTDGRVTGYAERFEYDPLRQTLLVDLRFTPRGGPEWTVPLVQRQFHPREMEALLHYNGFGDIRWSADFSDQAPDETVDALCVDCAVR